MLSRILKYLISKMTSREKVGLKKYHKTVDRTDLAFKEWSIHHEEELMDALMYNAAQRREVCAILKANDIFMAGLDRVINKPRVTDAVFNFCEEIEVLKNERIANIELFRIQESS